MKIPAPVEPMPSSPEPFLEIRIDGKYTFKSYIHSENTRRAVRVLRQLADRLEKGEDL